MTVVLTMRMVAVRESGFLYRMYQSSGKPANALAWL